MGGMASSYCPPCNEEDCHANANCDGQKKVKDCFATGVQLGVLDFGVVKVFAVFHVVLSMGAVAPFGLVCKFVIDDCFFCIF